MSFVPREEIAAVEARFGRPREIELETDFEPPMFEFLRASMRGGRRHDVTVYIFDERGRVAVIRKPVYPPGVFRAPSGGVKPGEPFLDGLRREAYEETGLEVEIARYVLRCSALFRCGDEAERWTTHVFVAHSVGTGDPVPIDTHEIAEARWATREELRGPLREALLATGWGGLRYRATLGDAVLDEIERLERTAGTFVPIDPVETPASPRPPGTIQPRPGLKP